MLAVTCLAVRVSGTKSRAFQAYRTSQKDQYADPGEAPVGGGVVSCTAPPESVTTFFGK